MEGGTSGFACWGEGSRAGRRSNKEGPFVIRLQFPDGYHVAPHTHPKTERVTVISGALYLATGEALDRDSAKKLPAGSFGYWRCWNETHCLVRRRNRHSTSWHRSLADQLCESCRRSEDRKEVALRILLIL